MISYILLEFGQLLDDIAASVRIGSVADNVTQTDEVVDVLFGVSLTYLGQCLEVAMHVGEDSESHRCPWSCWIALPRAYYPRWAR